jgi:hypothetical protein
MDKNPLIIYWAPAINLSSSSTSEEMLYPEPTNLLHDLIKIRNKDAGPSSFLSCPAASGRMKRSFVFRNNLQCSYHYDFTDKENPIVIPTSKTYLEAKILRSSALQEGGSIVLGLRYIFFSEESVLGYISPPMMHEPGYTKSATTIPGAFDISKWFRPFVMEVQTWKTQGDLIIKEDEPLFYFEAATEREVVLKRFEINDKLMRYLDGCVQAPVKFGKYLPLQERYKRFMNSRMNELVIKEIKENLVDR